MKIGDDIIMNGKVKYAEIYYPSASLHYDGFMESGTEYYENGSIKFVGEYNEGPRTYYGPRYFIFGRLFNKSGILWYEGSFHIRRSSIGYAEVL